MSEIEKPHPLSSKTIQTYRAEYARGAQIFKEALEEYNKTSEYHKKEQLMKAMQEALNVMDQLANYVLRDKKIEQKLSTDFQNLAANDSPENLQQLNKDIENISKKI